MEYSSAKGFADNETRQLTEIGYGSGVITTKIDARCTGIKQPRPVKEDN
jgi:hypothetical protein